MEAIHRSSARGYLFVFVAILFWGGSAAFAKLLFTTRYDPLIITQMRSSLSFVLLALFFIVWNPSVFRIRLRDAYKLALIGVIGIAGTNYAYYFTIKESTVATAILVQNTAPAFVMIYAVAISREEALNGIKVVALLLSLAGCYLAVSGGVWSEIRLSGWALVSAPGSMLCYVFMLLASKRVLRTYSVWTMLVYAFGVAAVFWLLVNPPWTIARSGYGPADWGIFWLFAVCSILIPHSFFTMSLRELEATNVGIATTMEPIAAIILAYLVVGEAMTPVQSLGAVAVVSGVGLLQVRRDHIRKLARRFRHAG